MIWYDDFSTDPSTKYDFYNWYYSPTWSWDSVNKWIILKTSSSYGTLGVLQKTLTIDNAVIDIDFYEYSSLNSWDGILARYTGTTESSGYKLHYFRYQAAVKTYPPDAGTIISNPSTGAWRHLRAMFSGSAMDIKMYTSSVTPSQNPTPYGEFTTTDTTYSSGRFGFGAYYTDSYFDNLIVRSYVPSASIQCCSASENNGCSVTCPSGQVIVAVVTRYGASNCNNLPACPNNIGAKCAGTPSCIGATTCSYTFNNANCGDTWYGYVKTGTLTVFCSLSRTNNERRS
jgi:hypothetical protein